MEKNRLNRPIFIVGGVRSGTTILGEILSQHDEVAYWLEPKYIWKYKKARANDDYRYKSEATANVKKYIYDRFLKFTEANNKTRFVEKTPSNVFRVPFMYEIFPDGLFVQIVRNGNDTILSAEKKWTTRPASSAINRRLFNNEIPLADLPFYFFDAVRDVIARFLFPNKGYLWGHQFKGIKEYRKNHSVFETCAVQWVKGVRVASDDLSKIPRDQLFTFKYEELVETPRSVLEPLLDFLELDSEKVIKYAEEKLFSTKDRIYTEEQKKNLKEVQHIINEEMENFGYQSQIKNKIDV